MTTQPSEQRHRPTRTCVGCGRKAPQDELIRFVARDGTLAVADATRARDGGRSAYTCRRLSCFERAASRNAFSRTLKRTARVAPELSRHFTSF